jgi:hypothetical protein
MLSIHLRLGLPSGRHHSSTDTNFDTIPLEMGVGQNRKTWSNQQKPPETIKKCEQTKNISRYYS